MLHSVLEEPERAVVDVDGDGALDVFVRCDGCGDDGHAILYLRNTGVARRPKLTLAPPEDGHPLVAAARLARLTNDSSAPLTFGLVDADGREDAILAGVAWKEAASKK